MKVFFFNGAVLNKQEELMRCSESSSWSPGEVMSQDPAGAAVARVGGAGAVQVEGAAVASTL